MTDVYALATLCWEVLVGTRPWEKSTEADRAIALRDGENLDFSRLPGEAPPALVALLRRGVEFDPLARPSARELCDGLRSARELIESGRFDVFLSHCWNGDTHAPATTFVLRALRDSGFRVWVDVDQMGHALKTSMREGIAASTVVVALVSRRYAARPNCKLELRAARETGKAIVSCLVEPDEKWWPPTSAMTINERELAAAINPAAKMLADLRKACAAGEWASASGSLPAAQRALLNADDAVPRLVRLVSEKIAKADIDQGRYDVYLSYAWGLNDARRPFALELDCALSHEGLRVCIDHRPDGSGQMGLDMKASMRKGIANSKIAVVLMSPDYAENKNCGFELDTIVDLKKPLVICTVEPGFWKTWLPADHRVALKSGLAGGSKRYVDLGEAAALPWAMPDVPGGQAEVSLAALYGNKDALPRLLRLVKEASEV
jgi:hypothetical protein